MTIDTNCPGPEAAARALEWVDGKVEEGEDFCAVLDAIEDKIAELRAQPQGEPVADRIAALERAKEYERFVNRELANRIDELEHDLTEARATKREVDEQFAQLQARCFDGFPTGSSVFTELAEARAEVKRLRAFLADIKPALVLMEAAQQPYERHPSEEIDAILNAARSQP